MIEKLKKDIYIVTFTKKDGEIRKMICTLQEHLLPETKGTKRTLPENLITVYDLKEKGWRSFYKDRVIKMEIYQYPNCERKIEWI